jgi:uncharacterized repeat protein (TIGR02543 family)
MVSLKIFLSALCCLLIAAVCACVKVPEYCGNGYELNPETEFCHGNRTYKKCNGGEYNPKAEFCSGAAVYRLCGGNEYSPSTEFCEGGEVKPKPPELYTYTVSVTANPAAGGAVSRSPDKADYAAGEAIRVTAAPATGYTFKNWTGASTSSENPLTITVDGNKALVAVFEKQASGGTTYALTTAAEPVNGGSVTLNPGGASYAASTQVTATAVPAGGYAFKNWKGASASADNPVTITMNGAKTLTAVFEKLAVPCTLTTGVTPAGGGSVTRSPESDIYAPNTQVTVTAVPGKCHEFNSWTGASLAPTNPLKITMDGSKTLIAKFDRVCEGSVPGEPLEYAGQAYRTVVIGGKTWVAENLNYDTANNVGSWCYDYSPDSCGKYGRLYNWNTAMAACPAGWHLPTREEWGGLASAAGGAGG